MMQKGIAAGLLFTLMAFLAGCSDFILAPIGTNSAGLLVMTLNSQGDYVNGYGLEEDCPSFYLTDSHGSFLQEIPSPVDTCFLGWPQLTPDGKAMIYLAGEEVTEEKLWWGSRTGVKRWSIHRIDLVSGSDRRLIESKDQDRILNIQLDPTGKRLAYLEFAHAYEEPEDSQIQTGPVKLFRYSKLYVLSLTEPGAQPEEVSSGVLAYRWSRDGNSLLFLKEGFTWGEEEQRGFTLASLVRYDFPEDGGAAEPGELFEVLLDPGIALWGAFLPQAVLDWVSGGETFVVLSPPIYGRDDILGLQLYSLDPYSDRAFLVADGALYPAVSPDETKLAFIKGEIDSGDCQGTIWGVQGTIWVGELTDTDPVVRLRQIAGPGCYSQLFWASESELGYVEEGEGYADTATIWIYDLKTARRFNLSAALARHWSRDEDGDGGG